MILIKFFILGSLTSLLYPPFFMLPLGFIIFPSLIYLISNEGYQKSFLKLFFFGFIFGLGFLIIYLSWIFNPFLVYEATQPYAFIAILLPICLSIFFGLGFLIYKFFKNFLLSILVTPFIFLFIEFLISNFIYGFPWISHSLILSNNLFGFHLLKFFGTFTSSFIIILIFSFISLLCFDYKIKNLKKLVFISYSPLIFLFLIPIILIFTKNKNFNNEITIDTFQILKPISDVNKRKIEENIINLINKSDADYIIFAENNFPYLIDVENPFNLSRFIKDRTKVIIGGTTYKDKNYYNSFVLFEEDKIQFFHKKILVPFGEFLPFRKFLKFMETISGNVDFSSGTLDRILVTKDNLKILPIICYEIIFDKIFKNIDEKEIDILINITNDSWFGTKVGPYQHFYITRVKSLISNRPLIRVSNNGISAIIDNNGNIIKFSKLNKTNNLKYKLIIQDNKSYLNLHKFSFYYLFFIFLILYRFRVTKHEI